MQDGTLWLVRDGEEDDLDQFIREENLPIERGQLHPPAEFVQACAPCETCHDKRGWDGHVLASSWVRCPDCRIELVGPCKPCKGMGAARHKNCTHCDARGTVTLGRAYVVGQPLPIVDGRSIKRPEAFVGMYVLNGRVWLRGYDRTDTDNDLTDRLAHYGPPDTLVGKWALQVQVTP